MIYSQLAAFGSSLLDVISQATDFTVKHKVLVMKCFNFPDCNSN